MPLLPAFSESVTSGAIHGSTYKLVPRLNSIKITSFQVHGPYFLMMNITCAVIFIVQFNVFRLQLIIQSVSRFKKTIFAGGYGGVLTHFDDAALADLLQ